MNKRFGLKNKVLAFHRANPSATAPQIAASLDCSTEYVRATAQRNSLKLSRAWIGNQRHFTLSTTVAEALQVEAISRNLSVAQLVQRLLDVIAGDGIVDAILDDGGAE